MPVTPTLTAIFISTIKWAAALDDTIFGVLLEYYSCETSKSLKQTLDIKGRLQHQSLTDQCRVLTKHTDTWLPEWSRCPGSGRLHPCSSSPADPHTPPWWWRRGSTLAELLPCHQTSTTPTSVSSLQLRVFEQQLCILPEASTHGADGGLLLSDVWFVCSREHRRKEASREQTVLNTWRRSAEWKNTKKVSQEVCLCECEKKWQ